MTTKVGSLIKDLKKSWKTWKEVIGVHSSTICWEIGCKLHYQVVVLKLNKSLKCILRFSYFISEFRQSCNFNFTNISSKLFSTFGVKEFVPISYVKPHAVLRGLLGSLSKSKMLHFRHCSLFDPLLVTSWFSSVNVSSAHVIQYLLYIAKDVLEMIHKYLYVYSSHTFSDIHDL